MTATVDGNDWVIDSPGGFNGWGCQAETPTRVRCVKYGNYFLVATDDGNDTVNLNGNEIHGDVSGGRGNDTLLGNSQRNLLDGGPGNDVIKAGRGPDRIYSHVGAHGGGHDSLFGQRGADRIHANNRRRDRRINCGPGKNDVAIIDRGLDPHPIGREKIRYGS